MPGIAQTVIAAARMLARLVAAFPRVLHQEITHLPHHLPAAIVVASLVTICHHQFHLLDAIDSYAFLAIGNRSAAEVAAEKVAAEAPAEIAVVAIDQQSHEKYYRERSPLNRCELLRDLRKLYCGRSPPRVMVIDLDLSPALLVRDQQTFPADEPADTAVPQCPARNGAETPIPTFEPACEKQLYSLFRETRRVTQTVLINPFPVEEQETLEKTQAWVEKMAKIGVRFGDSTLQSRYGLVTKLDCKQDGLAAVAYRFALHDVRNCLDKADDTKPLLINPRHYLNGIRWVHVRDLPSRRTWIKDDASISFAELPFEKQVVFFGGGYGMDDTHLTPLGDIYGVAIHAAAFLSLLQPTSDFNHFLGFGLEIALALVFSLAISLCWKGYYLMRFQRQEMVQLLAPILVLILAAIFIWVVWKLSSLSFYLLASHDLWLSPIPIAIGMLIESFFAGAVHKAVEEGRQQRRKLALSLEEALREGNGQLPKLLEEETRDPHHPGHSRLLDLLLSDAVRKFGGPQAQPGAATLQLLYRLLVYLLLGLALYSIYVH
ncbi:CHASE2 domain protein [compost metagenome]